MDEKLKLIKSVICEVVGDRLEKTILFGSRARGEGSSLSDYDILVVLKDDAGSGEKIDIAESIRGELAELGVDADIIVKTRRDVEYLSDKIGSLVRAALEEGTVF